MAVPNQSQSVDPDYVDLCPHTSRKHCRQQSQAGCTKVHYKPDIQHHTDLSLGDCSYLNTCHRMDTCRYLHWMVEDPLELPNPVTGTSQTPDPQSTATSKPKLFPPQWVNCDLRHLDVGVLGKFDVVMMDPPWGKTSYLSAQILNLRVVCGSLTRGRFFFPPLNYWIIMSQDIHMSLPYGQSKQLIFSYELDYSFSLRCQVFEVSI